MASNLPNNGNAYESDGNVAFLRYASTSPALMPISFDAQRIKLYKLQAKLNGEERMKYVSCANGASDGLNSSIHFTIGDASAELVGAGSSSLHADGSSNH